MRMNTFSTLLGLHVGEIVCTTWNSRNKKNFAVKLMNENRFIVQLILVLRWPRFEWAHVDKSHDAGKMLATF